MPHAATITITELQKVSDSPKAPYKIETTEGVVYKAWDAVGRTLRRGETYAISYDITQSGEYPSENMIRKVSLATRGDVRAKAVNEVYTNVTKAPVVDWAAKEEDMATLAMFKAVYLDASVHVGQVLDQCRMEWRAHKARMKHPIPTTGEASAKTQNANLNLMSAEDEMVEF